MCNIVAKESVAKLRYPSRAAQHSAPAVARSRLRLCSLGGATPRSIEHQTKSRRNSGVQIKSETFGIEGRKVTNMTFSQSKNL
jgi:hypothetical protein